MRSKISNYLTGTSEVVVISKYTPEKFHRKVHINKNLREHFVPQPNEAKHKGAGLKSGTSWFPHVI